MPEQVFRCSRGKILNVHTYVQCTFAVRVYLKRFLIVPYSKNTAFVHCGNFDNNLTITFSRDIQIQFLRLTELIGYIPTS